MPTIKGLTELESCALALVHRLQPCSTYRLRSEFAGSTTTEWSASAGSIYPVIDRLLRLKLVRAVRRPGDARGRRDLSVTQRGARAVREWILDLDESTASATPDPIRTRVYFLEQLRSTTDRTLFLERAAELTRAMADELRGLEKATDGSSESDHLAILGSRYQLEARLKWLDAVRAVYTSRRR